MLGLQRIARVTPFGNACLVGDDDHTAAEPTTRRAAN